MPRPATVKRAMERIGRLSRPALALIGGVIAGIAIFGGVWAVGAGGTSTGAATRVSVPPDCTSGNNGQEVVYAPVAGVAWRLRCNDALSTYKWEFVGGATLQEWGYGGTLNTATEGTGWVYKGPTVTAPRAGVYEIEISSRSGTQGAGGNTFYGVQIAGVDPSGEEKTDSYWFGGFQWMTQDSYTKFEKTIAAAGSEVRGVASGSANITFSLGARQISLRPIRIS